MKKNYRFIFKLYSLFLSALYGESLSDSSIFNRSIVYIRLTIVNASLLICAVTFNLIAEANLR